MTSRFTRWILGAAALPLLGMAAVPAAASVEIAPAVEAALDSSSDKGLAAFYEARDFRPLWIRAGFVRPDSHRLVDILRRADLDGMRSGPALAERLEAAIARAEEGDPEDLARAEVLLSGAWAEYVRTLRRPADVDMVYAEPSLAPRVPTAAEILSAAAEAPFLSAHLEEVSDLNPLYRQYREALAAFREGTAEVSGTRADRRQVEQRLLLNMERARALPAGGKGKYVLVDAASQRLWMYEDGEVRDSMKVIVGKPDEQTPMMAGLIRFAVLNPYWNVPPDLARKRVAAGVLEHGEGYLREKGYELLSGWSEDARVLAPDEVDWKAVASGRQELRVRQLPGPGNAMGNMKFMFPNKFGVYLHDTPEKHLFAEDVRTLSSGCVRVEDAPRLARWLFGSMPRTRSDDPEQAVTLRAPVPVYITYLTAGWDGERVALREDFYGRDRAGSRLASTRRADAD